MIALPVGETVDTLISFEDALAYTYHVPSLPKTAEESDVQPVNALLPIELTADGI